MGIQDARDERARRLQSEYRAAALTGFQANEQLQERLAGEVAEAAAREAEAAERQRQLKKQMQDAGAAAAEERRRSEAEAEVQWRQQHRYEQLQEQGGVVHGREAAMGVLGGMGHEQGAAMWRGRQEGQWQSDVQVQLAAHLADIAKQLGQMRKSGGASSRPRRIEADAMVGVGESQYPRLMQVLNYGTRAIGEYCNENSPSAGCVADAQG